MDLKHFIEHQRRRGFGPALDLQFATDKTIVPRVGPTPVFTRASSGTFVNANGIIVGKTTSTTSLDPTNVTVGRPAIFTVPSGSLVGWLDNALVTVMEDTDGDDQIGAQRYVTGTVLNKTDTQLTLLVTAKSGTGALASWFVSYRGARIDHDPATLACKGLLMEDTRTNILVRSNDLTNSSWLKSNTTATGDVVIAPDGLTTGDLMSEDLSLTSHVLQQATSTITASQAYVFTVFAKAASHTSFQMALSVTAFGAVFANFSLVGSGSVGTFNGVTAKIDSYSNGWYRCSIVLNSAIGGTGGFAIFVANNNNSSSTRIPSYQGTGAGVVYLWGAQLEAGTAASSYIPTTAASTIRAADVCTISGTSFSNFCSQIEGTLSSKFTSLSSNASGSLGGISMTGTDRSVSAINIFKNGNTQIRAEVVQGPSFALAAFFNYTTGVVFGSEANTIIAFKQDNFASASNNSAVQTDTSGTFPSAPLTQILIGNNGGQRMFGWISNVQYYRNRIANSSLQALSAIVTNTITYNGVQIQYNSSGNGIQITN